MTKPARVSIAGLVPDVDDATTLKQPNEVRRRNVQTQDTSGRLPHTSYYCHPSVLKALKEIAVQRDCKVHDLLNQGVKHVLAMNGKDFDTLSKR